MENNNYVKHHPKYWSLHKEIWTQEFNSLDNEIASMVVNDPDCDESIKLDRRVYKRIEQALLVPTSAALNCTLA